MRWYVILGAVVAGIVLGQVSVLLVDGLFWLVRKVRKVRK